MQLLVYIFVFKAKGPCDAPLAHIPSYPVLPYTTINVTSLKGCCPHPTPAGSASLPPNFNSPKIFPFHPLPLIWCWELGGGGHREQGDGSSGDNLGYQSCSPLSMLGDDRKNMSIYQEPHCFILLDEISGGCLFPAALGTLSAVLGRWREALCPSSCGCEEAWRMSSLLSLCQRKSRTSPWASQPLVFLKHFDHSHGHCIFILMLRLFFFFKPL